MSFSCQQNANQNHNDANKFDDLEQMDKFLETYNLSRLNHEEKENMNTLITRNKIESVIKNLPRNKSPGLDSFTGEFYQIPILLKLLPKIIKRKRFQTHFTRPALP